MNKHRIRIVGGQYRHTPIPVIDAPGLRPTPDRVRETLFNWLRHLWAQQFADKQVLDLFAGSGALGFEAASHGVAHVQMVEHHPKAIANLRTLRDKLKAHQVRIHAGDARVALARLDNTRFDLILVDPPFDHDPLPDLLPSLPPLLTPTGLVYIESDRPLPTPDGATLIRQSRAGQVHFGLLQFAAPQKKNNNHDIDLDGSATPVSHTIPTDPSTNR